LWTVPLPEVEDAFDPISVVVPRMATYCPQCNTPRPATLACTVCGTRLLPGQPRPPLGLAGRWMKSPLSRVFIGLVLSQGLFHGMRQFATGILLGPLGEDGLEQFTASFSGQVFWQALQGVGLLVGAALAGSSETLGFFYGTLVGIGNGIVSSALPQSAGGPASQMALVAQPLIQAALGLVGGWMGSILFAPLPDMSIPTGAGVARKRRRRLKPLLEGRIYWLRVLVGTLVAVFGVLSAGAIFDAVIEAGRGRLMTEAYWQDQIFTWEIKVLALLLGGALAGANTNNGFKQGLVVGLGAALVMASLPRYNSTVFDGTVLFCTVLGLCITGGWFGGELLPPIVRAPRAKHMGPMA
jgi:hypothetical protein